MSTGSLGRTLCQSFLLFPRAAGSVQQLQGTQQGGFKGAVFAADLGKMEQEGRAQLRKQVVTSLHAGTIP